MTKAPRKGGFASRPGDADSWVRAAEPSPKRGSAGEANDARLTIDVTRSMRRRIKLAALKRGVTLADLIREILATEFPEVSEDVTL